MKNAFYEAPLAEAFEVKLEQTILSGQDRINSTTVEDTEVVNGTW
jgi:hypothetical protein